MDRCLALGGPFLYIPKESSYVATLGGVVHVVPVNPWITLKMWRGVASSVSLRADCGCFDRCIYIY